MNQGKAGSNEVANPLWITYSWADNDEGDFDYLIQELEKAGIPAIYDKIALVPGRRLWPQIAKKITEEPLSGLAYLITPQSLSSAACQEELGYALQRALETQGKEFPLIGLLHQVSIRDVPLALRIRLCINLANPDWIEEIRAATIIGIIKDIERWPDKKKFKKALGVYSRLTQSGGDPGRTRQGKEGSRHGRRVLFQICFGCITTRAPENDFRDYYNRQVARGKPRMKALVSTMGKLAEIIYHCLKVGESYWYQGKYKTTIISGDEKS